MNRFRDKELTNRWLNIRSWIETCVSGLDWPWPWSSVKPGHWPGQHASHTLPLLGQGVTSRWNDEQENGIEYNTHCICRKACQHPVSDHSYATYYMSTLVSEELKLQILDNGDEEFLPIITNNLLARMITMSEREADDFARFISNTAHRRRFRWDFHCVFTRMEHSIS